MVGFSNLVLAAVVALAMKVLASKQHFKGTFSNSPRPFQIEVDPKFIQSTKVKVSETRLVDEIESLPPFTEGPIGQNASMIRDEWVKSYDWFQVEKFLNTLFHHYTTTVTTTQPSNYTHAVPLHFVHHKSPRTDAIPLLFIHGWPGSFLEVSRIITNLTHPESDNLPAFHVVAPSLPGFAFSPPPKFPGLNLHETGNAFNSLMLQLGYTKYVIQGGDYGGLILRFMAVNFPQNVLSVLSNFWLIPPNAADLARYAARLSTSAEKSTIEAITGFTRYFGGYKEIQERRPLTLAYALTDSAVGLAMWIYDLMKGSVEGYYWTPAEVITWSMMHWIPGPYSGLRLYHEALMEGVFALNGTGFGEFPGFVKQPVAVSQFPKDLEYPLLLDWARRAGNVVALYVHSSGGHFAAYEKPTTLIGDIRAFWGNRSLSNLQGL